MPEQAELPPITLSEPDGWQGFSDGGRAFYADPRIISESKVYSGMKVYQARTILDGLEVNGHPVRGPTNRECNIMADQSPVMAGQMERLFIFASVLGNVETNGEHGYIASHIEGPEFTDEGRMVDTDPEKMINMGKTVMLPPEGWFSIDPSFLDGDGFPQVTCYPDPPVRPCAYFMLRTGSEMAVLRGRNYSRPNMENRAFAFTLYYTPTERVNNLGILAVCDEDPKRPPG